MSKANHNATDWSIAYVNKHPRTRSVATLAPEAAVELGLSICPACWHVFRESDPTDEVIDE